jgi:hypothetical protein
MTVVDEATSVEAPTGATGRTRWVMVGLGVLLLVTVVVLFALGVGGASAAGGCGGG